MHIQKDVTTATFSGLSLAAVSTVHELGSEQVLEFWTSFFIQVAIGFLTIVFLVFRIRNEYLKRK